MDRTVPFRGSVHRNPDCQHIGRGLAKVGVVLVRRHAGADTGRFIKRLNSHQHRLAVNEPLHEVQDVRAIWECCEVRVVLLHAPQVPKRLSVRLERAVAGRKARRNVPGVSLKLAAHNLQSSGIEETWNADAAIPLVLLD
jgi:hypothetical protein